MVTKIDRRRGRDADDRATDRVSLAAHAAACGSPQDASGQDTAQRFAADDDPTKTQPALIVVTKPAPHAADRQAGAPSGDQHGPGELTTVQRSDRRRGAGERRASAKGYAPLQVATSEGGESTARPLRSDWLLRLPRVSSLAAMWSGPVSAPWKGRLIERAQRAALAAGAALEASITIEDVGVSTSDIPIAGFRVAASLGEEVGACEARLCPSLCAALLESLVRTPSAPIATHPDPVTAAVLGHGALLLCKSLGDADLVHPRLLSAASIEAAALCLELRIRVAEKLGHLQIRLDERAARSLTRSLDEAARRSDGSSVADLSAQDHHSAANGRAESSRREALSPLPVNAKVCMGPVKLSAATLLHLRPGDAICPDPRARLVEGMPTGPVFLSASKRAPAAIGLLEAGNISITALGRTRPTAEETTMKSTLPSHGALAIEVHVVLDTLPMTLAELSRVGPGTVLSLSGPTPRVKLQAGEETIAVGELVDVEGILGVRILEGASR